VTTTKPPERRELVLPWHSIDKQNASDSSQWQQSNVFSKPGERGWALRRKTGDGIEQWTRISPVYVPEQLPEEIPQERELDKPGQPWENPKPPPECAELIESDKNRERPRDQSKQGRCGPPQNEIDFERKQPARTDGVRTETQDEDLYEGVALDSTVIF